MDLVPRFGSHRSCVLLSVVACLGLSACGESEQPRAPLPESRARALPLSVPTLLGGLCGPADSEFDAQAVRESRAQFRALLLELRRAPDGLVTAQMALTNGRDVTQKVTVRELARQQTEAPKPGVPSAVDCFSAARARLQQAIDAA